MGNSDTKLNFRKAVIQLTTKTQVFNGSSFFSSTFSLPMYIIIIKKSSLYSLFQKHMFEKNPLILIFFTIEFFSYDMSCF